MDSWEALIIQWVNCLHENANNYIHNIEELKDGRIYYELINKLRSWNSKEYGDCKKDIIFEFLKDEYPNFICNSDPTDELCIGLLILSRLSLEPVFHKSLCVNLSYDLQIKVKSILETIYALGKNITAEDLCKTFSLSDKTDFKSLKLRSKRILEEFLNSPVVRSVHSEKKMYEQTKHIRHLRADIETLRYEKSELIEDIKVQKKQINELQNKLQETASELKLLRADATIPKNYEPSQEKKDTKSIELFYKNELHSLEKYVAELQNDNCKLQDEKSDLISEVKSYKTKCCTIEEKNMNNDQLIESMLLQIEKKDDEMTELKMKYEELRNYLKEKSMQLSISNESFEVDDLRRISEISFNRSEALSSVIEIQLQDTKKDLAVMQNKFINLNLILNAVIEEYVKQKSKYDLLLSSMVKIEHIEQLKCEKCELREKEVKNVFNESGNIVLLKRQNITKEQCIVSKLMNGKEIRNEMKLLFADIFKDNLSHRNNFLMEFVNQSNRMKGIKKLKNNIAFVLPKNKNEDLFECKDSFYNSTNCLEYSEVLEKTKSLEVYKENKKINFTNSTSTIEKFCKILCQENWFGQLPGFEQILNRFIRTEAGMIREEKNELHKLFSTLLSYEHPVGIHDSKNTLLKSIEMKCSKHTQTENQCNRFLIFYKSNLEYLQSLWISLRESAFYTFKIHRVLFFLNENWNLILNSSKDVINKLKVQPEHKELLKKTVIIETELKNAHWKNLQTLSLSLINSVQFVTLLSNSSDFLTATNVNLQDWFLTQLSNINLTNHEQLKLQHQTYMTKKIITIKRRLDQFHHLISIIEKKYTLSSQELEISEDKAKKIADEKESIKDTNKDKILDEKKFIKEEDIEKKIPDERKSIKEEDKEKKIPDEKKSIKEEDITQSRQFQKYMKEVHEKYEIKLEKMKEKMKSVYNSQISTVKKEQETLAVSKLEALQLKFENQCYNHTEELKKYKKHISELTTQLWDVGEKLIIEKQKKEDFAQKLKEIKGKNENSESQHPKSLKHEQENYDDSLMNSEKAVHALQSIENTSFHKMQSVRGFQIMGNAFRTEDEEGEVFDTTYLADMQRPRESVSSLDLDRLSILQMRNSKCKPHLKSSYPGELQIHPVPFSEDEIKTGCASEEVFNDSLSQSLLTGKKVKRSNRTRPGVESPRKGRRFSHIFRKPRLSLDRK